ncbi:murein biosynthesis integral membrane protein MurJ [Flindersiella endophytica]
MSVTSSAHPRVPPPEAEPLTAPAEAVTSDEEATATVSDSLTVAVWTIVSRVTGVLRGATVAAVLGATFFANTYQFTTSLPSLVYYGFLGGSMFTSLLIPALVKHIDTGDSRAAARVAGGFFGMIVSVLLVAVPIAAVIAVFGMGQSHASALLVLMLMPAVPFYAVVGSASAVMNAHRRFALAAAAPAAENIGMILVLVLSAVLYPTALFGGGGIEEPPLGMLLLLGLGASGAVGAHAFTQWWGARRVGVVLRPRAGWRDPEVRTIVRRAGPSLVQACVQALQLLLSLLIAGAVAGGVVAFQLAMNFYYLPIALGATPVALALAPRLSRMTSAREQATFRETYLQGLAFALFLAIPAAVAYGVLSGSLATAISFGGFGSGGGPDLLAAALLGLALGVAAETVFLVTTYACYARNDTKTPLWAMLVRVGIGLALAWPAVLLDGSAVLLVLGLAWSLGGLAGAAFLARRLLRGLPRGPEPLRRALPRIVLVSAVMAPVAWGVATGTEALLPDFLSAGARSLVGVLIACVVGGFVYLGLQSYLRAPELSWVLSALKLSRLLKYIPQPPQRERRRPLQPRKVAADLVVKTVLLLLCAAAGVGVGISPIYAVAGLAGIAIVAWVVARPQVAAYLLIVLTPLTAGIDRGTLVPVLRPNEAVAVLVAVALFVHWVLYARSGSLRVPKLDKVDWSLIALAMCNSVVPILAMMVRGKEVTGDDYQHAIVLWKYLVVYAIVRYAVKSKAAVYKSLWLSIGTAALVCVIGVLQALNLFGVPALLGILYAPFGVERTLSIGRGGSTLALPAAVGDLAILNLALAVALIMRGARHRKLLAVLAVICVFGVGAAGEFSSILGLLAAVAALLLVTASGRLLAYTIPVALVGGVALWPVIETRLMGFQSASGIPDSWLVRYHNLSTYFWPDLFSHWNWLFGVQPAARVPAAHEEFGWVWIESGHTWLLWAGGVPLLAAYVFFVWVTLKASWRDSRSHVGLDVHGVIGTALFAVVAADVVLMIFDPHLTYRGAADAMFILFALQRGPTREPSSESASLVDGRERPVGARSPT